MTTFIFKQNINEGQTQTAIYEGFSNLLQGQPAGAWLIRESRVEGMITVTYKPTATTIEDCRYAFKDGSWVRANMDVLHQIQSEGFTPFCKDSIGDNAQQLVELIQLKHHLYMNALVKPRSDQASVNRHYIAYLIPNDNKPVFNNPINKLQEINIGLQKRINSLGYMPLPKIENIMSYEESFIAWTENERLEESLLCSINYTFFKHPLKLASGHVVDKDSIYDKKNALILTHNPFTRAPIGETTRLIGFRRALKECLTTYAQWLTLLQLCAVEYSSDSTVPSVSPESVVCSVSTVSMFEPRTSPSVINTSEDPTLSL